MKAFCSLPDCVSECSWKVRVGGDHISDGSAVCVEPETRGQDILREPKVQPLFCQDVRRSPTNVSCRLATELPDPELRRTLWVCYHGNHLQTVL